MIKAASAIVSIGSMILSDIAVCNHRCSYIATGICLSITVSMLGQFFGFNYSKVSITSILRTIVEIFLLNLQSPVRNLNFVDQKYNFIKMD